jgi:hypothetical protein
MCGGAPEMFFVFGMGFVRSACRSVAVELFRERHNGSGAGLSDVGKVIYMTEHVKGRTCIQPSPPFPGYAFGVPREKGVHDIEVTAFAASIFDRWRKKGLSLRAIEELTGIKHSQVSNVHQLKVGLGTSLPPRSLPKR